MLGIILALAGAALMSIANAGKKILTQNYPALVVAAMTIGVSACLVLFATLWVGFPQVDWSEYWWRLIVCGVVGLGSELLFLRGVNRTDFSLGMPLQAFMPIFGLFFGYVLYDEIPSGIAAVGVGLVIIGAYLIGVKLPWRHNVTRPLKLIFLDPGCRSLVLAQLSGAFLFSYQQPAVEKSSILFFYAGYILFQALAFNILQIFITKQNLFREIRKFPVLIFGSSLLWVLALGLTFASWTLTLKAYSSSAMQIGVIFSIIIGRLLFKEPEFRQRMIAGSLMLAGVVLIVFGAPS